jgi:hypothetical protein
MDSRAVPRKALTLATALAALAALAVFALAGPPASAAAAKPVSHECQHPVVTGEEAVGVKGVSVAEACKVVRSLGTYLSKPANIRKLYKCTGPGSHTPVLLMHEFEGWKLKLARGYWFVMYRSGASFRVTGTDFPVNCS